MSETREIRVKRLRLRAWHRGIKEMDLILGGWADRNLEAADDATLDAFEAVMAESDHDLYQWISGQSDAPAELAPMVERIGADMRPTVGRGA
ncbi:succinate dehydrogenase assembly factor 2 [Gymnodinialimonas ceratoperidinii]|uniref:Succinate dehydrogenase assembly factor 2 n=1 Tax=Gymnodinialimonas ceratoperidinii TaxID=2856823 RepID=A0A8F6TUJ8_9RHOB|nr:succinate dehydrogenase assembly factor 2 [Gymnodinialimonas ceratoperidinii]QXT38118.1 succinate dehydrogenase assembly factor 2 [Gymnodinialimonas ceratoperidinii]